jgi:hypothetical protein
MKKIYQLPSSLNSRETLVVLDNRNWAIAPNQSKTGENFVSQSFFSNITALFLKVSVAYYGEAKIQTGFKAMTEAQQYEMANTINQLLYENQQDASLLDFTGLSPVECFQQMDSHYGLVFPDSTINERLNLPEMKIIKGPDKK